MAKKHADNKKISRLIDANLNRLKEGLRVIEDILRFIANDTTLTRRVKKIRHAITDCMQGNDFLKVSSVLLKRQIETDVGKKSIRSELNRTDITDIFLANAQRVKESIRVLEEFSKLYSMEAAGEFKRLRYEIYAIEKQAIEKITKM